MSTIHDVATQFVDTVLLHGEDWAKVDSVSPRKMDILFQTVAAAGFNPKVILHGRLTVRGRDEDRELNGETYTINTFSPFKVVDQESGKDDFLATSWLDCACRSVAISGFVGQRNNRQELIDMMVREIEQSVPLQPIQLTQEGDLLGEYPPDRSGFGSPVSVHKRDTNTMSSCVGIHKYCNGWMDRKRANLTHDVLLCRSCFLRVSFPEDVKTYGDLRKVFALVQAHQI